MKANKTRKGASWTDVKAKLAHLDQVGLVGLVHDLYASSKDNQVFLHARFELGEDVLEPYKVAINRSLWPDFHRNQSTSVSAAKKSITSYKKAIGLEGGLAELMVFYCERASGFSAEVGLQDEGFFVALIQMFERALQSIAKLPGGQQPPLLERLNAVHQVSHSIGYGVDSALSDLLVDYGTYD